MAKSDDPIASNSYSSTARKVMLAETDGIKVVEGTTASIPASDSLNVNISISPRNVAYIVFYDIIASASTDFDIELYPTDTFGTNEFLAQYIDNNLIMKAQSGQQGDFYIDRDSTTELHMKIINNDSSNASTFTYKIYYKA